MRNYLRAATAVVGLGLFAALVVGSSQDWGAAGLGYLLAGGLICLVIALESHRIGGVEAKGLKFKLADHAEINVRNTLSDVAATYAFIHNSLGDDKELNQVKIRLQDQLVNVARDNAFTHKISRDEAKEKALNGTPAERVLAFGLMVGNTSLASVEALRHGIAESSSGNEQYHALLATKAVWPSLDSDERAALREAIRAAPYIQDDDDRRAVAADILGEDIVPSDDHSAEQPGSN